MLKFDALILLCSKLYDWSNGVDVPANGSLVQLITSDGDTQFIPA